MTWVIPPATQWTFRPGDTGIGVWAIQRALGSTAADGVYGPRTAVAVKAFQLVYDLTVDGIAGPSTQLALTKQIVKAVENDEPTNLVRGFALMEGGNMLAAVNWSSPGGTDCGLFQRRLFDHQRTDDGAVEAAFDARWQGVILSARLTDLAGLYLTRPGTRDRYNGMSPTEKAWRLAALAWNWPWGADILSRVPVAQLDRAYWFTRQSWVASHLYRFPDGTPVTTPIDWAAFYAGVLGAGHHDHPGNVTRFVRDWAS